MTKWIGITSPVVGTAVDAKYRPLKYACTKCGAKVAEQCWALGQRAYRVKRKGFHAERIAASVAVPGGPVDAAGRVVEVDEALDFHPDELPDVHVQGGEGGDGADGGADED